MTNSLRSEALNGIKWTTISAVFSTVLQIIKFAVLARLIGKEDFGLFATIAVILGIADHFVEAGLGSAVIHKQDATKEDLASAYTTNVIMGWIVFAVLYFAASPIAAFYNESRLIGLLHLASLVFFIQPLGRQYDALLRKNLCFNALAAINVSSQIISLMTGIYFAWLGYGVKALIYSQLSSVSLGTLCLMIMGVARFGFNIGFKWSSAKFFIRYSAYQIGENTINYFNGQLDTILIGRMLGQETLGMFYMAKQLAMRPVSVINPIVTSVSLPIFAKVQNDKERLKRGYLQLVHTLAIIQFAILIIIVFFSKELVDLFLGKSWGATSTLLIVFAITNMFIAIGNPIGSLQLAVGRVDIAFYWDLLMLFYIPPIIFVSAKWEALGIAVGLMLGKGLLLIPVWFFMVRKLCGATFSEYFGKLAKVAAIVFMCYMPLAFVNVLGLKLAILIPLSIVYLYLNRKNLKLVRNV